MIWFWNRFEFGIESLINIGVDFFYAIITVSLNSLYKWMKWNKTNEWLIDNITFKERWIEARNNLFPAPDTINISWVFQGTNLQNKVPTGGLPRDPERRNTAGTHVRFIIIFPVPHRTRPRNISIYHYTPYLETLHTTSYLLTSKQKTTNRK